MKLFLLILSLFLMTASSFAQSMTAPIPKPAKVTGNLFAHVTIVDTLSPGINYLGFRFTGPTVLYAINTTTFQQSAIFTGVGIDYESDTWDPVSNKFYTNYAFGLQALEGGQIAPTNVSAVTAAALTFSVQKISTINLPFKLTVGFIYNFTTKSPMLGVGPGIPLNN